MCSAKIGRIDMSVPFQHHTPVILYLNFRPACHVHEMKLAGLRRFAEAKALSVVPVTEEESAPQMLDEILGRFQPMGVAVECASGRASLPPKLFGQTPVVYIDCPSSLYGQKVARVSDDGKSTARAAFRELSSGRPAAYAVVGYREPHPWSVVRVREFGRLVRKNTGMSCHVFCTKDRSGRERAEALVRWISRLPSRVAVFAVNDETALEVLSASRAADRRVRTDMTLVGVDNLEALCEKVEPRLSSVQLDAEMAGFRTASLLWRIIVGDVRTGFVEYGPQLTVRRESTRGANSCGPRIQSAIELIRREACNGLTAKDVTKLFPVSRRLFELRFREAMGHSILDEIQNVRLDKVFLLLAQRQTAISAIASFCGYRSERALRKAFLQRTGMSLRMWRMRNCQEM